MSIRQRNYPVFSVILFYSISEIDVIQVKGKQEPKENR